MIKYIFLFCFLFMYSSDISASDIRKESLDRELAQVEKNLLAKYPILKTDWKDYPVIILAALVRERDLIKHLISKGVNADSRNKYNSNALHFIASGAGEGANFYPLNGYGATIMMKQFIEAGADINARGSGGGSPLMSAIENPYHREAFDFLVEAGADIYHTNDWGMNALIIAVDTNNISVLGALIELGVDVNHQIDSGFTALHRIAHKSYGIPDEQLTMLKLLTLAGADVNKTDKDGNTPLHIAAKRGNLSFIKALYKHNAKPNMRNKKGKTPFDTAKDNEQLDALNLMLLIR